MPDLKTENKKIGNLVLSEEPRNFSRTAAILLLGAGVLALGTVLGKRTKSTVGTVTPGGGDTGDGVPGAATLGADAQVGTYILRCIAAAANAGDFAIETPSGQRLAQDLTVAVAYVSDHLNLTIADGGADFIVGDSFTVVISGDDKYVPADPTLVNGAQVAAAILLEEADTTADIEALLLNRDAIVNRNELVWDASINTLAERDQAVAELETLGILARLAA